MRSMNGGIQAVVAYLVAGQRSAAVAGGDTIVLSGRSGASGGEPGPWAITGGPVTGLGPGVSRTLRLRVTNPHPYDIRVQRVHVTLTPNAWTGRAGCPNTTRNLVVSRWLGRPFLVRAGRTVVVPTSYQVRMPRTAGAACQGATFPLTYTGYATKAARR